jgi:DUF1707 SHOCT-like domain
MSGPGDERAAAQGQGRDKLRASHADREQVIEVLKVAFVQERLAKDEFDLRVAQAFAARTHAELAAVSARLPAEPATAKPPTPARARSEPPVVRPGPLLTVATAVCAGVWMTGFFVPWPRDSEGDPPPRSRLAGLPDHPHLPVRSGHDPVAGRRSDGSVVAQAAVRRRAGPACVVTTNTRAARASRPPTVYPLAP